MQKLFGSDEVLEGLDTLSEAMPLVHAGCDDLKNVTTQEQWDSPEGFNKGADALTGIKNSLEAVASCLRPCPRLGPHHTLPVESLVIWVSGVGSSAVSFGFRGCGVRRTDCPLVNPRPSTAASRLLCSLYATQA